MMTDSIEVPIGMVKYVIELKIKIRAKLGKGANMGKMGSLDVDLSGLLSELDGLEKILDEHRKTKPAATKGS